MKKLSQFIAMLVIVGYLMSPVDIAPDVIPVVGWLDDPVIIIVMLWASGMFDKDEPTYTIVNDDNQYLPGD